MRDIGNDLPSQYIHPLQSLPQLVYGLRQVSQLIPAVQTGLYGEIVFRQPVDGIFNNVEGLGKLAGQQGGKKGGGRSQDDGQ